MTFWKGKTVLVTGHTGFKGSWLSWWLVRLGANVHGLALPPPTTPSLFSVLKLQEVLASHTLQDIRDAAAVQQTVKRVAPEIVFHLAAQPLVRYSYKNPLETYAVNVMGTAHLFEAIRHTEATRVIVNVTSDKCYENREWSWPYREQDALGGHDPYSNSKACSELITAAYRSSFLAELGKRVSTARAGNVIGGGDWATDRLIPDFLRALDRQEELILRSPLAVRPWQHVLEPLSGYLTLAEHMWEKTDPPSPAYNFGPDYADARTVQWIVDHLCRRVPGARFRIETVQQVHEAHVLRLDSSLARTELSWAPRWSLASALEYTLAWHDAWRSSRDVQEITSRQIAEYERLT